LGRDTSFEGFFPGCERWLSRRDRKKTVVEQSQGATIRGFGEEKENGQTTMSGNLTYQM